MNDIQSAIDWLFTSITALFTFMMSSWILSMIVLCGLMSLIISLYLNARNK